MAAPSDESVMKKTTIHIGRELFFDRGNSFKLLF